MLPQSSLIIVGPSKELDPRLQLPRLPVELSPVTTFPTSCATWITVDCSQAISTTVVQGHHQVPFSLHLHCTASGVAVGLAPGTLLRHYGLEDRHH
ncbi:hypothetical protein SKAU_G00155770 [Synaphobranchus kaupii]|uniref:Uncharacterized protein n=1 Tax=Synaphobranchus kaupii TaxID=118154 RepID=A0A9Q1FHZ4_SYNKA|nr:hypothetical protein SKAU_G00155770 [Synaphobranchus kaupii]